MLTRIKAYSSLQSAPILYLTEDGRAETDLIQIRAIDGLDPVVAAIGRTPYASAAGEAYTGSSVLSRNLVLALHPNPDWSTWTHEALRRLLYRYFMPEQKIRLVFLSDDMPDVEAVGYVESMAANAFSKDPEYIASIICPSPYFSTTTPEILTGLTTDEPLDIEYDGDIPRGILVKIEHSADPDPGEITIQLGDSFFKVVKPTIVSATKSFQMNSYSTNKYVESVTDVTTSLLSSVEEGSEWLMLQPGTNSFSVISDAGVQSWELTYFELYGGL